MAYHLSVRQLLNSTEPFPRFDNTIGADDAAPLQTPRQTILSRASLPYMIHGAMPETASPMPALPHMIHGAMPSATSLLPSRPYFDQVRNTWHPSAYSHRLGRRVQTSSYQPRRTPSPVYVPPPCALDFQATDLPQMVRSPSLAFQGSSLVNRPQTPALDIEDAELPHGLPIVGTQARFLLDTALAALKLMKAEDDESVESASSSGSHKRSRSSSTVYDSVEDLPLKRLKIEDEGYDAKIKIEDSEHEVKDEVKNEAQVEMKEEVEDEVQAEMKDEDYDSDGAIEVEDDDFEIVTNIALNFTGIDADPEDLISFGFGLHFGDGETFFVEDMRDSDWIPRIFTRENVAVEFSWVNDIPETPLTIS